MSHILVSEVGCVFMNFTFCEFRLREVGNFFQSYNLFVKFFTVINRCDW